MNKKKINEAIKDMNDLLELFLLEIRNNPHKNNIIETIISEELIFDDITQDLFLFECEDRKVWLQMIKPKFRPTLYYVKDGLHIFTDVIKEAYTYLIDRNLIESRSTSG